MNPITPQQFQDHAAAHRRGLAAGVAEARTDPPTDGARRRLASFGAVALLGATAFFAGGVLEGDVTTPPPVVPVTPRVQAPECVAPAKVADSPTAPPHPRDGRHRDRLQPIPV